MFGFVTLNTDLIVTQWSEYLAALTGLPASQVIGMNLLHLFPDLSKRGIDIAIQHVLETGAPLSLSRILHRYVFPSQNGLQPEQSAFIHPLMQADQIIGVIVNIQDVSDRSLIENELRSRLRLLESLREIDYSIMAGDLPTALQSVAQSAERLLAECKVDLHLHIDDVCCSFASPHTNQAYEAGICAELRRSKKPLRILDVASNPLVPAAYATAGALLAIPLLENDQFLGALLVTSDTAAQLMGNAAEMLQLLATVATNAIVSYRIRQAQHNRMAELEVIQQISSALRAVTNRREIIKQCLEYALQLVKADGGMVLMPGKDGATLRVVQVQNLPADTYQMLIPIQNSLSGQAYLTAEPVLVCQIAAQRAGKPPHSETMRTTLETQPCWIFAPFIADGMAQGMLAICADAQRNFTQGDVRLLTTVADIAAVAIQRITHLEQAQQRARQLAILNEVSQQLANTLETNQAYTIVVNNLVERFQYALAIITEVDNQTGELVLKAIQGPPGLHIKELSRLAPTAGITALVLCHGRTILSNQAAQDPRYLPIVGFRPGSELCAPVFVEQDIVAAITVEQPEENAFEAADQDVLETMAAHLGITLSNIQRF